MQESIIFGLLDKCKDTVFGRKYGFKDINTIEEFQDAVPISHYKDFERWITYMLKGEKDITYPGKIDRFATSSWTTGWTGKYIPVTKEALKKSHFKWGTEWLNAYCKNNPRSQFLKWKWLVIWGSFGENPYTWEQNVGFISAILQKNTPWILSLLREPRGDITYIDNWEEKLNAIVERAVTQNITLIYGQPAWVLNLFYKALEYTKKENILEIRPELDLFFWWGLPIDLYKSQFTKLIPSVKMKYYQAYNASEGFFAMQDENFADDMLLLVNHGTFYEFIPSEEYGYKNPTVLTLEQVEVEKDYILVITNCSWLRRYIIGDVIRFTNLKPRKIKVVGRTKYFIDIIGERVFLEHVEKAILQTSKITNTIIGDYMVWPLIYEWWKYRAAHEWIIEFVKEPNDIQEFTKILDEEMWKTNIYYFDERHDTQVLGEPKINTVKQGTFYDWLKFNGKLGGQFKIPKLSNDRENLDSMLWFMKE